MFTLDEFQTTRIDVLLNQIESRVQGKKVAIIGGHYLLMNIDGELVPLIKDELQNESAKRLAENFAGDFPIKSFEASVDLYGRFQSKMIDSKIVLLVNDHKFQSRNFQPEKIEEIRGNAGNLRREYYLKNAMPESYKSLLDQRNYRIEDVIYLNKNSERKSGDLLPKDSLFYSEQKLRNRFDKFVKPELIEKGTIYQQADENSVDLYYDMPALGNEIPLTEEGTCGCSAEVLELIGNLQRKGFTEIVFFVPHECAAPVDNGVMAALNINGVSGGILTITGFGGVENKMKSTKEFKIIEQRIE